jgi:UDP-N-acetylglucosamine--N-acetylmuramyl-(pentapeptide) pyrophosphoryl-undecaprenol N-acetylglucosamine transferase
MEQALVARAGIAYRGIDTGQLRGKNPLTALANAGKMLVGIRQSQAILDEFRPAVCLVTGGYVCAPVVMACRLRRIPVLIYLPDMTPGWAIRSLSKLAQRVAVSFPDAAGYFGGIAPKGKAIVTGYPVRQALVQAAQDRAAARRELAAHLGRSLDAPGVPLLFVFGGSLGSRSINQAVWQALPAILPHAQVLHVIGQRDWTTAQTTIHTLEPAWGAWRERYHPVDYLHEGMPLALAAADLAVARAGASTLGEFPVAGLPSILAPLPIAGVNQVRNAEQLARHGAAAIVQDDDLTAQLGPTVVALLTDDAARKRMGDAALGLARPDAARRIAQELLRLGTAQPGSEPSHEP